MGGATLVWGAAAAQVLYIKNLANRLDAFLSAIGIH
jgi:hypothetical protein